MLAAEQVGRTLWSARRPLSSIGSTTLFIDARIAVDFLPRCPDLPRSGQALLLSAGLQAGAVPAWTAMVRLPAGLAGPAPGPHGPACACCSRPELARILTSLFQARAKGEIGFFRGVTAVLLPDEAASLRMLLETDPFLSGCYVATDATIDK